MSMYRCKECDKTGAVCLCFAEKPKSRIKYTVKGEGLCFSSIDSLVENCSDEHEEGATLHICEVEPVRVDENDVYIAVAEKIMEMLEECYVHEDDGPAELSPRIGAAMKTLAQAIAEDFKSTVHKENGKTFQINVSDYR